MYIERLVVSSNKEEIRNISFHKGLNLIVDSTPTKDGIDYFKTGNSVGKTTVLKLINYCLGSDGKDIYTEEKVIYDLVKDFLIDEEILVTLVLTQDFLEESEKITIKRNFLARKKKIITINDKPLSNEKELGAELNKLIFCSLNDKPTFQQIKSHNIRYNEPALSNTLHTLNMYTALEEYETLYLFLLGLNFADGEEKQRLNTALKQEIAFKNRLESKETKTGYISVLNQLDTNIKNLENKKISLNLNDNFNNELTILNDIKRDIRYQSSLLTSLNIKKNIILEAKSDLSNKVSDIDVYQLKLIYQQATSKIDNIQKSFEELTEFHNKMLTEKINFIIQELPSIQRNIDSINKTLADLKAEEQILTKELTKSVSFQDLELLTSELNEQYRKKGEYEGVIAQIEEAELKIGKITKNLDSINSNIFTKDFKDHLQSQIDKFNNEFSLVSQELYDEKFTIKFDIEENKKTKKSVYKFSPTFTSNQSTGKKQGEIVCFDIGYVLFAEKNNISHLKFLLNDRKELMHGNQLRNIANFIKDMNIQFIASILEDKLPIELQDNNYYIIELSQSDKFFRIEELGVAK